jgi:hypothetical protein
MPCLAPAVATLLLLLLLLKMQQHSTYSSLQPVQLQQQ